MRVNFVVMRPAETLEEGGSGREGQYNRAGRRPEPQFFRRQATFLKVLYAHDTYTSPEPPQFRVRSVVRRHLRQAAKMKAAPWSPAPPNPHPSSDPPGSKGPGCCLLCHFGATVLLCCFFGAVSLRGRGSKPLTVSFRLPSRAFASGAGGVCGGVGLAPSWEEDEPPTPPPSVPASPLVPHRLAEGNQESSLSTHPLHYKRPVLILTRCLRPLPPHLPHPPITSAHLFL